MSDEASEVKAGGSEPVDPVKLDFENALARLVAREPTNSELKKFLREGRLKISPSSVAREAGHSRTLIGHAGCKYSDLRKRILDYRAGPGSRPRASEVGRLRAEITELRKAVQLRDTIQATILVRNRELEDEIRTLRRTYSRVTKLRAETPEEK